MPMGYSQYNHDGLLLLLRAAETIDFNEKFDRHSPTPSCYLENHGAKSRSKSRESPTFSSKDHRGHRPNSRCSHNELEKTRRAHLRDCMDSLKHRLNFEGDTAARITMLTVLKKASSSVQSLMHQNQILENREAKEKRRYNQLIMKRQALRKKRDLMGPNQCNLQSWRGRNSTSECSVLTTSSEDSEVDSLVNRQSPVALQRFAQSAYGYGSHEINHRGYTTSKLDHLDGAMAKIGVAGTRAKSKLTVKRRWCPNSPNPVKLSVMNAHIICGLCGGYLVSATIMNQCLHPFCRSCLLIHLAKEKACPLCQLPLQDSHLVNVLTYDATLQSLVYKLVPGLLRKEMLQIRKFYESSLESNNMQQIQPVSANERWCLVDDREFISLTLSHPTSATEIHLLCPGRITVAQIVKFLSLKFDLSSSEEVTVCLGGDCLDLTHSLLEVAFIYSWNTHRVLRLSFIISLNGCVRSSKRKKSHNNSETLYISPDGSGNPDIEKN